MAFGTLAKREKPVASKAHKQFIAMLPCIACAVEGRERRRCDAAHVSYAFPGWDSRGKSEKVSDLRCVPLCREHHDEQHSMCERSWWARLGLVPVEMCAMLVEAYPNITRGDEVIWSFAGIARRGLPQIVKTSGAPVTRRPAGPVAVLIEAHFASIPPDEHGNRAVLVPAEIGTKAQDMRVVWVAPTALQAPEASPNKAARSAQQEN